MTIENFKKTFIKTINILVTEDDFLNKIAHYSYCCYLDEDYDCEKLSNLINILKSMTADNSFHLSRNEILKLLRDI